MQKPYVISAELDLIGPGVVQEREVEGFRGTLDADLRGMGKETVWVSSSKIQSGLREIMGKTNLPIVSLDDRYVRGADDYLGISRSVNGQLDDAGYEPRAGYAAIETQIDEICALGGEVIIADDVVFSGEMIARLDDELKRCGVKIGSVICGIAIGDGMKKILASGIDVEAVEAFSEVEEEICERDFAVVPGSGRRVGGLSANVLYFDNINGRPEKWASLPAEYTEAFCFSSIERSIRLLQPDIPMRLVGNFIGYGQTGTAQQQLNMRIGGIR